MAWVPAYRSKRIDVRKKGVEKVRAESRRLPFVEVKAVYEIILGIIENLDLHDTRLRMSALACSQSENRASPEEIRRSRSLRTSRCQSGDSRASELRLKSAHRASINWSFSEIVISLSGSVTGMVERYSKALAKASAV